MKKILPLDSLTLYNQKIKDWANNEINESKYDDTQLKEQININKDNIIDLEDKVDTLEGLTEDYVNDLKNDIGNLQDITEILGTNMGDLEELDTTVKSDLVSGINETVSKIHDITTAEEIEIHTNTTTEGMAKSYTIVQGGVEIGVIDIPKDMVVSSGRVEVDPEGMEPGTYIVLVLADEDNDVLYINVASLVNIYTAVEHASQIQLEISADDVISASIVEGSVTATEIADNAVTTNKIADGNVTTKKLSTTVQQTLEDAENLKESVSTNTTDIATNKKNIEQNTTDISSLDSSFTTYCNDSGWQSMTISSGFAAYSSNVKPRYRKIGKLVEVSGAVSPTTSGTGSTDQIQFGTLPSGYRPSQRVYALCQGSSRTKWVLSITTGGVVSFGRYSDDNGWASYSSSTWLPFTIQFFID